MSPPARAMVVGTSFPEAPFLTGHCPLSPGSQLGGSFPVAVPPALRKFFFVHGLRARKHTNIGDGEQVRALPQAHCWLPLNVMLPAQVRSARFLSSHCMCMYFFVCISLWMGFPGSGQRFAAVQAQPALDHRTHHACRGQLPPTCRHRAEARLALGCCPSAWGPGANQDGLIHRRELATRSRSTSACGAQLNEQLGTGRTG